MRRLGWSKAEWRLESTWQDIIKDINCRVSFHIYPYLLWKTIDIFGDGGQAIWEWFVRYSVENVNQQAYSEVMPKLVHYASR